MMCPGHSSMTNPYGDRIEQVLAGLFPLLDLLLLPLRQALSSRVRAIEEPVRVLHRHAIRTTAVNLRPLSHINAGYQSGSATEIFVFTEFEMKHS